jgi:hypothetical protein
MTYVLTEDVECIAENKRLRAAQEATQLFHGGLRWLLGHRENLKNLTGSDEAMMNVLCNFVRRCLELEIPSLPMPTSEEAEAILRYAGANAKAVGERGAALVEKLRDERRQREAPASEHTCFDAQPKQDWCEACEPDPNGLELE